MVSGKVYLVGSGPGDPALLTVAAAGLLESADVVFHDDLVSSEILKLIPDRVHVESVGKRCGHARLAQHQIHFVDDQCRAGWLEGGTPEIRRPAYFRARW